MRKTEGRISQGCAAVYSGDRSVWRNAARMRKSMTRGRPASFHDGVEYNQACHCQWHFCSETCITDCVVLSDSIGFSEWGRKREGKRVRLRMTDIWPDSQGRKVHILLYSQVQALFIDVEIS